MKKLFSIAILSGILLGVALVWGYSIFAADVTWTTHTGVAGKTYTAAAIDVGDYNALAVYPANLPYYSVFASVTNDAFLTSTTQLIIIDIGDTVNYPHSSGDYWCLKDINVSAVLNGNTGVWKARLGVVVENDATDGTVWWFWSMHATGKDEVVYPKPLSPSTSEICGQLSGATPTSIVTNEKTSSHTDWDNDDAKGTAAGGSANPGVGDLVLEWTEITDGNGLTGSMGIFYRTVTE